MKKINTEDIIILVCKVNVGEMDDTDVPEFVEKLADLFKCEVTNLVTYVFPTRSGDTEVQILTPKLTTKKKTKEIEKQLEDIVDSAKNKLTKID